MGIKDRLNNFFFLEEDSEEIEEVTEQKSAPKQVREKATPKVEKTVVAKTQPIRKSAAPAQSPNIVAINHQQAIKKPRINVMEPRTYSEVQSVADILLNNQSVILNFRRMEKDQAKKVIDFLMGTTYAIKGDIERIGDEIFVCTPNSVELDGAELQALKNQDF
ncbi:cell division protein SepF [Marinilactibacillus sp. XAAS-LB27]|uniref:cell division protein SepF n=1 Tax=Marinilactibacillus sp. XAAS-LB27 TaxID=3114538 RepID=UPI002E178CDD|nr:cell division protein SepF [Marinilactibacillus sp. XAAS-LB27]